MQLTIILVSSIHEGYFKNQTINMEFIVMLVNSIHNYFLLKLSIVNWVHRHNRELSSPLPLWTQFTVVLFLKYPFGIEFTCVSVTVNWVQSYTSELSIHECNRELSSRVIRKCKKKKVRENLNNENVYLLVQWSIYCWFSSTLGETFTYIERREKK